MAAADADNALRAEHALEELKRVAPKVCMVVTDIKGKLAPKSLRKYCSKEGVQAAGGSDDCADLLQALLDFKKTACQPKGDAALEGQSALEPPVKTRLFSDAELQKAFAALAEEGDFGDAEPRLTFERWLQWQWLRDRFAPVGAADPSKTLTRLGAERTWARIMDRGDGTATQGAGLQEFMELARALEKDVMRATFLQSLFRGNVGRCEAHEQQVQDERTSTLPQDTTKLAPFNPTPACAIAQALTALDVGPGDTLYDLGCGDGRLLVEAGKRGASAVGVEHDARYAERALEAVRGGGLAETVRVVHGDACEVDLSPATKIFVYLVPTGLQIMEPKLAAALERGVPIASYLFSVPGWTASEALTSRETRSIDTRVWVYRPGVAGQASKPKAVEEDAAAQA